LFNFGIGGSASGVPALAGGATGSVASGLLILDSSFFNEATQGFIAGSSLQFQMSLTTKTDVGGVPDQFSLAILDSTGSEIPTKGAPIMGSDTILLVNIDSGNPIVQTFSGDTSRNPVAGGSPIPFTVLATPVGTAVPEPGTGPLLITGAILFLGSREALPSQGGCGSLGFL
jgi:hypothetical protein